MKVVAALDNELSMRMRDAGGVGDVGGAGGAGDAGRNGDGGGVALRLQAAPLVRKQRWPADVEYAAFMIAREAVGNALLHARASRIGCELEGDARRMRLRIVDDGAGMPAVRVRPGHLGVVGTRERSLAIGASFSSAARAGRRHRRRAAVGGSGMTLVYLVDDHPVVREGLRALLEASGLTVLGKSADPTRALAEMAVLKPEVVLLDLGLGERSGFAVLLGFAARGLQVRALVLSMSAQPRHVAESLRMGALGYVLKGSPVSDLLRAIAEVASGRRHLGPEVADLAFEGLEASAQQTTRWPC